MRILIAEHAALRAVVEAEARALGFECLPSNYVFDASTMAEPFGSCVLWLDSEWNGAAHLMDTTATFPGPMPIVLSSNPGGLVSNQSTITKAVTLILQKPFGRREIQGTLQFLLSSCLSTAPRDSRALVGISAQIGEVRTTIGRLSSFKHPILVLGETGTGKDRVAYAIHSSNPNRKGPFVPVDCGSLPPALIENELFGHAKGAFTGAGAASIGLVSQAAGGTLFLDEIGELPLEAQTRLLRVIQEREVRPIGSTAAVPVDIRIIAATNQNLKLAVEQKRFREDLYFRLNTFTMTLPPLRERTADIPFLAQAFSLLHSKDAKPLSVEALDLMMRYSWPGNVRELQNILLRAWALAEHSPIKASDLDALKEYASVAGPEPHAGPDIRGACPSDSLAAVERMHIFRVLVAANYDKVEAARRLGIGKTTLYRRLREYGYAGRIRQRCAWSERKST